MSKNKIKSATTIALDNPLCYLMYQGIRNDRFPLHLATLKENTNLVCYYPIFKKCC